MRLMSSSLMSQVSPQLPPEIWTLVFGYLSPSDRFNVRTCSKLFKKLVDHPSLWADWTIVLPFKVGFYNPGFWSSLRRRKIRSVLLRSSKMKDWEKLIESLPDLSTLILDRTSHTNLSFIGDLHHLKRLVIRDLSTDVSLKSLKVSDPLLLTHLSLCGSICIPSGEALISLLSKFTNLTSLVYHSKLDLEAQMIYSLLAHMPKLRNLSLFCGKYQNDFPHALPGEGTLSSLEIRNFLEGSLPEHAFRGLQGLTSLALFYRTPHFDWQMLTLKAWLMGLPKLSTLVIVNGPALKHYFSYIPPSVTSLTLSNSLFSKEDVEAVAPHLPNLLHLHMDPFPSYMGAHIPDIPRLFPNLKSLKLHHQHVPEGDFLLLHKLQHLEHLEILDNNVLLPKLIAKLQALTQYRLRVTISERDLLSCRCGEAP